VRVYRIWDLKICPKRENQDPKMLEIHQNGQKWPQNEKTGHVKQAQTPLTSFLRSHPSRPPSPTSPAPKPSSSPSHTRHPYGPAGSTAPTPNTRSPTHRYSSLVLHIPHDAFNIPPVVSSLPNPRYAKSARQDESKHIRECLTYLTWNSPLTEHF
jgi:hypothetical protein